MLPNANGRILCVDALKAKRRLDAVFVAVREVVAKTAEIVLKKVSQLQNVSDTFLLCQTLDFVETWWLVGCL
jgi:hypothetical protein